MISSDQSDNLVGTVLQDSFRLTRRIGEGGMGTVYEGTQLRLNKRVAVKLLARQLASNDEALARFRREAEVTSQLGHPHIVQVFDFGTAPTGEPYLVMEYLEGEDLDQRLRRAGRMPLPAVVHILRQVASALTSTHARGIVHRDLKPANIFVLEVEGETDFVKIVDFGISKVRAASVRITGASVVMGTPNYMSPEQAVGRIDGIDHTTDQWSLACIAYELLAGRGPFVGDTIQSLLYQVVHQEPASLSGLVAGLPPEVESVIRRALRKQQETRFPTVNDFARAFAAAAEGTAPVVTVRETPAPVASPAPPPEAGLTAADLASVSRRGPRRIAVAAAGLAVAALAGLIFFRSRAAESKRSTEPVVAAPPPAAPPAPAPVATAPPPPVAAPPPEAPPAAVEEAAPPRHASHGHRGKPARAAAAHPGADADPTPSKTTPPPAPKRRLIEDL